MQSTCITDDSKHRAAMFLKLFVIALLGLIPLSAAELKVAVLHPLLADLVRQIGGNQVEVIDLIGPNGDPHHFEPKPDNLIKAEGATLYLAAGMGLETYLPKLRAILANQAEVIEVAASLPSLKAACEHDGHDHEVDPHWWHSIDHFRRVTGITTEILAKYSPEHAADFRKNAEVYRRQLDELERWAKREISKIPRDKRHLATTHAAFNYFCKDFSFIAHPMQGMSREQVPAAQELAALIADLQKNHVAAIFPERESNPKLLKTLTLDTGIRLGEPLIADGTGGGSYLEMYRHNVTAIVGALTPPL
jgi:zinc/manganese transport system substrate-binding protein